MLFWSQWGERGNSGGDRQGATDCGQGPAGNVQGLGRHLVREPPRAEGAPMSRRPASAPLGGGEGSFMVEVKSDLGLTSLITHHFFLITKATLLDDTEK